MSRKLKTSAPTPVPVNPKPIRGIDWSEIFARRPDLEPPGYKETVELIKVNRSKKALENA